MRALLGSRLLALVVLFTAVLLLSGLLASSSARAEGPNAVQALGGCTDNSLAADDDPSTGIVPIGFEADFFGEVISGVYVNSNGNVTFNAPLSEFTPFDFTATGQPIIAPFLADVDTTGAGSGLVTYGQTTVDGAPAFCVNWLDVGYFDSAIDKLNSFQMLLISRPTTGDPGNFDIVFNYDKIQWETGDASGGSGGLGGSSAALGYANGDGNPNHFFVKPGSYENGALLDSGPSSTSLIAGSLGTTQLGRYIFEIRNGAPIGLEPPVAKKTVNVRTVKGIVKVKLPGERDFTVLSGPTQIPVGSQLDTTAGRVEIVSASDAKGGVRTGEFYDGVFKVKQKKLKGKGGGASAYSTVLQLVPNVGCGPGGAKQRGKKKGKGNGLWGDEKGGGHTSVGSAGSGSTRGTVWFVGDRCDGSTLARVKEGKIKFRDFELGKTIILKAGESYVAGG